MIVRDAAGTLERCLSAARPHVAEVCVLDTGSTDGTLELLDRIAARPGPPIVVRQARWRGDFGAARNRSIRMASPGIDWVLTLDADDVLKGGRYLGRLAAECDRRGCVGAWIGYDVHSTTGAWASRDR